MSMSDQLVSTMFYFYPLIPLFCFCHLLCLLLFLLLFLLLSRYCFLNFVISRGFPESGNFSTKAWLEKIVVIGLPTYPSSVTITTG